MIKKIADFNQTIGLFDHTIPRESCQEIIDVFEDAKSKGICFPGRTLGGEDSNVKDTWDIMTEDLYDGYDREKVDTLNDLLASTANTYVEKYIDKFPHQEIWDPMQMFGEGTYYPSWQIQKYEKGVGHYNGWHTEEPYKLTNACRLFVVMWYLNDVHEGGTTDFLYSEHSIQPQAGRFLCWPAGFPWIHRGSMPISEDKYIITTWLQANWGQKVLKWNQEEEKEKTEKDS